MPGFGAILTETPPKLGFRRTLFSHWRLPSCGSASLPGGSSRLERRRPNHQIVSPEIGYDFCIHTNFASCFLSNNARIWSFDAWRTRPSSHLRTLLDRDGSDRKASNSDLADLKMSSTCDCWSAVSFSSLLSFFACCAGSKCPFPYQTVNATAHREPAELEHSHGTQLCLPATFCATVVNAAKPTKPRNRHTQSFMPRALSCLQHVAKQAVVPGMYMTSIYNETPALLIG